MGLIEDKLKLLPTNPGVYVMLDKSNQIIYVGKAKNLKNRVRQYFFNSVKTEKVMAMVSNIADFYYIITPSEIDALSLENNLIKKHKPHYNILLKDDKTYPYLKVNLKEDYPTFTVTRKIKKDGAKYFGPFMGGINVGGVLETLNLLYGIRPCDKQLSKTKTVKPCLNYHIKKCSAPCAHLCTDEEYNKAVENALSFMSGNIDEAETTLKKLMTESAEKEEFELAVKYRESLNGLEKIKLKRITSLSKFLDADIIAYKSNGIYSVVNILVVRKGRMLGGRNFSYSSATLSSGEALSEFISNYYKQAEEIPDEIITGEEVSDKELLSQYFKKEFNKAVTIICAKQGIRKSLFDMADANASEHLETAVDRIKHKDDMTVKACESLKEKLHLTNFPHRIECYDISNISGVDKVGSMVVFINGEKQGDEYRRFKIKTFDGADDYRSHQEMMTRRLERMENGDEHFPKPDLMVIDGGKGQLSAIMEVFAQKNVTGIDLIALAEKNEEVFVPNNPNPIVLDKTDYCLKMLQRIRDEAHRFAITYFRSLHGKNSLSSVLDGISGIGKAKRNALLNEFKDLGGIITATKEQLMEVEGIGEKQAQLIIDKLTQEGLK